MRKWIVFCDSKGKELAAYTEAGTFDGEQKATALSIGLEELDFSVRTFNCLRRAGKNTLGEIADMTMEELLKVRNLGRKSPQEVVNKLAEYGMTLAGDRTIELLAFEHGIQPEEITTKEVER